MMKIRYALLLSVSCLGLGSLAHAGLTLDITPIGKNTFIFTHTNDTHLASQSKLLSTSVIARRTSSDAAIHSYFYGSPRRINSPRDDDSDDFLSTQHKELEASRLLLSEQDTADLPLTASVCFITDAGECSGGGAGIDEPSSSSSGPGPIEPEPGKQCALEGYVNDVCPEGQQPGLACPYDSGWHTGCVCKPEYNLTCSGSDEQGKGASCNGKYKECCKLCSGYDYTASNIPSGYVKGASCTGCDGVKYKIKCDTNSSNTGTYIDCGSAVGSGGSCTDDTGTYYEKCTCPMNYEFNAQTQTCVCKTNFKYACTGTGYAGGQGESCDNKYQTCECATGYSWSATLGCVKCGSSFKYACTGANEVKPSGSNCGGLYDKCSCKSGYKWSGGKCVVECADSYKYTCTGTGYAGGAGSACGGKYTQCTCASGYEWKNGSCQQILDGPHGNLCYCNGNVVGVKADGMDFFVGMKDLGQMFWPSANSTCQKYNFCSNFNGLLPTVEQLDMMYDNKSSLNSLLLTNGGVKLTEDEYNNHYYWSSSIGSTYGSTNYYYAVEMYVGEHTRSSISSIYYVRPVTTCQEPPEDGPFGDLYYCNGKVVGVKAGNMDFYVAMQDLGSMPFFSATNACRNYSFCSNLQGTLPTKDQLLTMYNNKSSLETLLISNGGKNFSNDSYWSSTYAATGLGDPYYIVHIPSGNVLTGPSGYDGVVGNSYYGSIHNVRPILIP